MTASTAQSDDAVRGTEALARRGFGMRRSSVLALLLRLAPGLIAAVAGGIVAERTAFGALAGAMVITACSALESSGLPLRLMPIGRVIARMAAAAIGVGLALATSLVYEPASAAAVAAALVAAWSSIALILGIWRAMERRFPIRVAVVGSKGLARSLRGELRLAGLDGYELVGRIETGEGPVAPRDWALGTLDELERVVDESQIELLIVGGPSRGPRRDPDLALRIAERAMACCLDRGIAYIRANQLFEALFAHVPLGRIDATWFEHVMHPSFRPGSPLAKRAIGAVLAAIGSVLTAPLVAVAAIAIKLTDGGPVIYRQRRVGERGREFDLLKLRTMRLDAEAGDGPAWALPSGDPRVTRVGRILRRTHMDELPQLWQVVTGRMALVGPRPERPELVAQLERRLPFYGRRHLMRPGITGWAQVRCGYSGSLGGSLWKLAHDLYYLKHRSLIFDALILIETLATPIRDLRLAARVPDERFLLDAIREEDQIDPGPGLRLPIPAHGLDRSRAPSAVS